MSNARNLSKVFSLATHVANLISLSGNRTAIEATTTGSVVQVVETDFVTSGTTTAQIPTDDTIPQITEGLEIMTASITPKFATSTLYIDVTVNGAVNSAGGAFCAALFRDSTANALAASTKQSSDNDFLNQTTFRVKVPATAATATTFRVRVGPNSAITMTYNGNAGTRKFGGVMTSSIRILEVLA